MKRREFLKVGSAGIASSFLGGVGLLSWTPRAEAAVREHDVDEPPPAIALAHVGREVRRRAGFRVRALRHRQRKRADDEARQVHRHQCPPAEC